MSEQKEFKERQYASAPLISQDFSLEDLMKRKRQILEILNTRFLPYWSASSVASLRESLLRNQGFYRIRFFVSDSSVVFEYSTARSGFCEVPFAQNMNIDEEYWLIDILDFLDGKLEMYSSFWHNLDPKKIYRLWTCLGANFCNNDLVEKKYRYHFERARNGDTAI